MPIIPAFWRLRQDNREIKASLDCIARLSQKTTTTKNPRQKTRWNNLSHFISFQNHPMFHP
jgi:hypothetical protein